MSEFLGKTVVVSGGTRGIGRAIVEVFAKEGCNVAFTYNKNKDEAKQIEELLTSNYKIKAKSYFLDILEPKQYIELFNKIDEDFSEVNFFISNAIISGRSVVGGFGPFMKLKPNGLINIYTATVLAFVIGAQEAAKRMEKIGGGVIITLSSTGNITYTPNYAGHGSSKAAVEVMAKYAASELGDKNIRVNAVSGGPIDTDALKAFPNYEELKAEVIKRASIKRMGVPMDIAEACLFLCSNKANWITGQTIIIDGGCSFK